MFVAFVFMSLMATTSFAVPIASCPKLVIGASDLMEYVELCDREGHCKKFSRLVMGTDHLVQSNWAAEGQPELSDEETFKVLDEATKHGINFFDTSPIYVGAIENKLGRWRASRMAQALEDELLQRSPSKSRSKIIYLV